MKITPILALAASATIALTLAIANSDTSAPVAGKVHGRIVFDGKVEAPKPLKIKADQAKGCCADGSVVDPVNRSLLIGADKGIANVVITHVGGGSQSRGVRRSPLCLDQAEVPIRAACVHRSHWRNASVRQQRWSVPQCAHLQRSRTIPLNKTVAAKGKIDMKVTKAEPITIGL